MNCILFGFIFVCVLIVLVLCILLVCCALKYWCFVYLVWWVSFRFLVLNLVLYLIMCFLDSNFSIVLVVFINTLLLFLYFMKVLKYSVVICCTSGSLFIRISLMCPYLLRGVHLPNLLPHLRCSLRLWVVASWRARAELRLTSWICRCKKFLSGMRFPHFPQFLFAILSFLLQAYSLPLVLLAL